MANAVRVNTFNESLPDDIDQSSEVEISAEIDPESGTRVVRTGSKWIHIAATILLLGITTTAIAICLVALWSWRAAAEVEDRDSEVLNVASTMAANLVTLSQGTAEADLARVVAGTTGDFRDQFVSATDGFGSLLSQGGVDSTGEVKSAGIVESSDGRSTVLAAVTSTVKNNEAPEGEIRVYRMKLTLESVDDHWLVSNVEFVA